MLLTCLLFVSAVSAVDLAEQDTYLITTDDSTDYLQSSLEKNNDEVLDNGSYDLSANSADKISLTIPTITVDIKEISLISPIITDDKATVTVKLSDRNKAVLGEVAFSIDGGKTWFNQTLVKKSSGLIIKSYFGYAEYSFTNLTEGNYNVLVKYKGNEAYAPVEAEQGFEVGKYVPNLNVQAIPDEISVTGSTLITITVTKKLGQLFESRPTGNVSISLDGINWIVKDLNSLGIATYTVGNLSEGDYTVYVKYNGDRNYYAAEDTDTFTVTRLTPNPTVIITPLIPTYGDTITVTVVMDGGLLTKQDPTGTISFSLDNKTWYKENIKKIISTDLIEISEATHLFLFKDAGKYTVYMQYSGDDLYKPITFERQFTIRKANPEVEFKIEINDGLVFKNAIITALIDGTGIKDPTGTISFTLDDRETVNVTIINLLSNSFATHLFTGLNAGNHTIVAKYNGDDNYNVKTFKQTFEVKKEVPKLKISVDKVNYGPDVEVSVSLDDTHLLYEPTGTVSFSLDGKKWIDVPLKKIILDPHASYTFKGLDVGNYTVFVRYNGDERFASVEDNKTFEVTKYSASLNIDVAEVSYSPDVTVKVKLSDRVLTKNPTGTISLSLDGVNWVEIPLPRDLSVSYTFKDLAVGNYTLFAKYNGDKFFYPVEGNKTFEVSKLVPVLDIITPDATYGDDVTITAILKDSSKAYNPTGTISFSLDGINWIDVPIKQLKNPQADITFKGLSAGVYTVYVKYNGDTHFFNVNSSKNFTINKAIPTFDMVVDDITYNENATVIVTTDSDATGTVLITIGDVTKEAIIENGVASDVFEGLTAGEYDVFAVYMGDKNYTQATITKSFIVKKAIPKVDIYFEPEEIIYHDDVSVIVNVPEDGIGVVYITIRDSNNKTITKEAIINEGVAIIDFAGLGAGNYDVFALYTGDSNYNEVEATKSFSIEKAIPSLDIEILPKVITYQDNVTVIVTTDSDATGAVLITIGHVTKEVIIENGVASAVFEGLGAGEYNVVVSYSGNQNYSANTNTTNFAIEKQNPTMKIDVLNSDPMKVKIIEGDDTLVIVTLEKDATGYVSLSIDGGNTWVNVNLVNGIANYIFKDLKAGEYTLLVKYSGDANYNPIEGNTTFVVEEAPKPIHGDGNISMANTGNPLVVLLISLFAIGLGSLKRRF